MYLVIVIIRVSVFTPKILILQVHFICFSIFNKVSLAGLICNHTQIDSDTTSFFVITNKPT